MHERMPDGFCQFGEVVRAEVGQVHVLRPVPDLFVGVEFRGIPGQPFDPEPMGEPPQELIHGGDMNRPTIQEQDDPVGKMFQKIRHEGLDVGGTEIVFLEREVQVQVPTTRRDREGRNPGQAVVTLPPVLPGRVPTGRPRPPDHWLEHKARFIEKNEGSPAPAGFFLSVASRGDAIER